jgi:GNAT superfamily N-acetyltransferase
MMPAVTVVSAFPAGRGDDAAALVFEYLAATQAETGQAVPAGIGDLPAMLQHECRSLPASYQPPGALLIACHGGELAGCAGLAHRTPERTAEIKRLYVRPAHRGHGIARTLMSHAHQHAARHGMTRIVLDVLPARTHVISFYRSLGYTGPEPCAEPRATESPVPVIYLERPITSDDLFSTRRSRPVL